MLMTWFCAANRKKSYGNGFDEVCRRGSLKGNVNITKVMLLNGEKGLECEICVMGRR